MFETNLWEVGIDSWSVCTSRNPWLDAVAAASVISGEVSFAVVAGDSSGVCILHTPVSWRLFERNDYELGGAYCGIQ